MFDSAPPNLPVEPMPQEKPAIPPSTQPVVQQPVQQPAAPMESRKKEPEDIFSNLDLGGVGATPIMTGAVASSAMPRRSVPIKLIVGIVAGILILGGGGYAAWSFFMVPKATVEESATEKAPVIAKAQDEFAQQVEDVSAVAPLTATTTELTVVENTPAPIVTPPEGIAIPLPIDARVTEPSTQVIAVEGMDADADGVTDVEESLLGTNPQLFDTDGDGYGDGAELKGLYSPLAKGAGINAMTTLKRVDLRGMNLLLPQTWKVTSTPDDVNALAIDTGSLAFWKISSRVIDPAQSKLVLEELRSRSGSVPLVTKSGIEGVLFEGGLSLSFVINGTIVDVSYITNGATTIEYRALFDLMFHSLVQS